MTTLDDFGGGNDISQEIEEPEHEVWLNLSRWFSDRNTSVFWEEDPTGGKLADLTRFDTFKATGNDRGDLLVIGDERVFVVEVKHGKNTSSVNKGFNQTCEYFVDYTRGDTTYYANGSAVDVDAFVLATGFSPDGSVFARWHDRTVRDQPVEKRWMSWAEPPIHCAPDWEYSVTESTTRVLWEFAKSNIPETADSEHPGIGTVLSSVLDSDKQPERPEVGGVEPFERAHAKGYNPMACYKRPVANAESGPSCHNWGWVE